MLTIKNTVIIATVVFLLAFTGMAYLAADYLQFRSGGNLVKDIDYDLLHEGDVIFRKGRSMESYAVYLLDPAQKFSHTGMIVFRNGNPCVVHVVPGKKDLHGDTVRLEDVNAFISGEKASSFAVYRPLLSEADRHRAAEAALRYYRSGVIFDHDYDLATEERLYCTELVYKAFKSAGLRFNDMELSTVDLGVIRRDILLPGDLLKNASFQIIINNSFTN